MMRYAGIGSRETPDRICERMTEIAQDLSDWVLRSGFADGADQAFERGSKHREIFIPWPGFNGSNGHRGHIVPEITYEMREIAESYHPAWSRCSDGAKKMHARNVCQVLGLDCRTPVDLVICWTPGGSGSGGTGQALRIARGYDIPVVDLGSTSAEPLLSRLVKELSLR